MRSRRALGWDPHGLDKFERADVCGSCQELARQLYGPQRFAKNGTCRISLVCPL